MEEEEEEGEGGALRAHRHSNPITDCVHRTAGEEEREREKKRVVQSEGCG